MLFRSQGVKGGKASAIPDELKSRMAEFHNEGSNTGRAKKAAGLAVRQVLAKFVGIAGLIALLAGLAMSVAAFLWP